MSVIVVATALPKPEHRDEVITLFEQAITAVHTEDGCELYSLNEGKDRVVMIEKWADRDALAVHSKSAALQTLGAGLEGKLTEPLDVQVLRPHPAGVAELGTV